jgi:hypothetical protein
MRIAKHIIFHYLEERISFVNTIINEINNYKISTDIFIHTNNLELDINYFIPYTNGCIEIIHHDMTNQDPYSLPVKCKDLLKEQRDDYDIFMYMEDDILVPYTTIEYWLKYHPLLLKNNCNLGFFRIEIKNDEEYITDLQGTKLRYFTTINEQQYCINNTNPYCAFWIYNKTEFNRFVDSKYYDNTNIIGYNLRESIAIGLHGISTNWYKYTLIPIENNMLHQHCKIYHMSNNYVNDDTNNFATLIFNNAIYI